MNGNRRKAAVIATLGLIAAGLTIVATATPGTAATFTQRWCSVSVPAPCVVSATRNGVAMHAGDPMQIQMIPKVSTSDFNYTEFQVLDPNNASDTLSTSDNISIYMDLGTLKPDYTEGYAGRPVVDRQTVSASDYRVTYTGHPVLHTTGCTSTYPDYCKDKATSQDVEFTAEIHQLKSNFEFEGFDRSQSADNIDGVYLVSTSTGDYLESNWNNPRYQTDGSTLATAQARFRIPYSMLISDFKIPNPATMVASSLVGTVNGAPATYSFSQDPLGGAVFVDISGVTFPPGNARVAEGSRTVSPARTIRVKRGAITPTAPVLKRAKRTSPTRARLTFAAAKARGAKIRGYQGRCQASGHPTIFGTGTYPTVVVKGLKPGRRYLCSVRAQSKAGPGRWSSRARV